MPQAVRHKVVCRDGFAVATRVASLMALTLLLPAVLRRRRDMREFDVEVVPPDGTPFVVQLLSTGELPGLTADPHLPDADRDTREQPRAEATDSGALAEPEHHEQDPEVEPIAASREPDPAPPEVAEAPSTAVQRRATRKRRATTQRARPPHRNVPPPRPATAVH